MLVWIVESGDWESSRIERVFSAEEDATSLKKQIDGHIKIYHEDLRNDWDAKHQLEAEVYKKFGYSMSFIRGCDINKYEVK